MLALTIPAIPVGLDPEATEQVRLIQWAKRNSATVPALSMLFHIPNGGHRSKREGAMMKLQGVRRGIPDLCLPAPRNGHHGLWIEMKPLVGGTVSSEQSDWHAVLRAEGYAVHVCRGFDEASQAILKYLAVDQSTPQVAVI
jgi:hypothetical protein